MRDTRAKVLFLAIFSVLFVIGEFFFVPKNTVNSAILNALSSPRVLIDALSNRATLAQQMRDGQLENQSLRALLEQEKNRPGIIKEGNQEYLLAPVYSVYPLNNAGRLTIAAGTVEGVKSGMAVLVAPGIFLGEVVEVFEHQSEVRTITDLGWELPVKIGAEKSDALLVGGHRPTLTLISKKKNVTTDMNVLLAVKKYPYGLSVGTTGDVADSSDNLFKEAPLVLPYEFSSLNSVYIIVR
jgi:cell shape-determining protein MreC